MAQQQGWWSADPLESDYKPARPAASDSWWESDPIAEPERPKAARSPMPTFDEMGQPTVPEPPAQVAVIPEPAPFVAQDERTTAGAMGRQVARGAIETAALAPKGAAALGARLEYNEQDIAGTTDRYAAANPQERAQMRREVMGQFRDSPGTRDSLMARFSDIDEGVAVPRPQAVTPIEQRATYKAGEAIDEYGRTRFPTTRAEDEAFWTGQVPRALGSTVAMAPVALAGAPFGALGRLLAGVGLATTGAGEATQNAVDRRRGLEDMVRAGDAPSPDAYPTDRQIATAAGQGLAPGALDAAAIDNLLRPVVRVPGFRGLIAAIAKKAIEQGAVEGTTEGVQQVAQNIIAKLGYNPSQEVLDQVAENVLVGGAVGFLTGGLAGGMLRPRRSDPSQRGAQTPQAVPQQEIPPDVSRETAGLASRPSDETSGAEGGARVEVPQAAPQAAPAALPQPSTPSPEDLQAVLDDPRPVAEIMAERERQAQRTATIAAVEREDGPEASAAVAKVMDGAGRREAPMQAETAADVDMAAAQAAQPTPAQAEAGNYRKGHVRVQGLDIAIEVPEGGERAGVGPDGRPWSVTMPAHYGYLKAGKNSGDGKVDVFVGDEPSAPLVYVIDQIDPATGKFDEPKVMLGMDSQATATAIYEASYSDGSGAARMGAITRMTVAELQTWLRNGDPKKPLAYVAPQPAAASAAANDWNSDPIVEAAPTSTPISPSAPPAASPLLGAPVSAAAPPEPAPTQAPAVAPADPMATVRNLASQIGVNLTGAELVDIRELLADGVHPDVALEIALERSGLRDAGEIAEATQEDAPDGQEQAAPDARAADRTGEVADAQGARAEPTETAAAPEGAQRGEPVDGGEQDRGNARSIAPRASVPNAEPQPKLTARERREEKLRQKRDAEIKRREAAKKAIQTRKANAGALNIVQTIAAAGGIKDTSGDLRTIMGRPNLMVPVYGALRNDKGMDPDRAREMLVEAGFLPEGATLNDLYAAIDQTVRGKPVMSARDVNEQLDRTEERKAQKYGDEPKPEDGDGALKDAGEKIGGSRADRWRERGLTLSDLEQMSGADASAATTKQNVWKPDYAKMIEGGAVPKAAALVNVIYDAMAAKPERDTPEGRAAFVEMVAMVRDAASDVKTIEDAKAIQEKVLSNLGWHERGGWKDTEIRAKFSAIFKGRSSPLGISFGEMGKAQKLIDAGFPAAVDPWTRRFSVRNYNGKWIVYGAGENKYRRLHEAATKEEAEAWARAEYDRTKSSKAEGVEPERPHLDKIERRGADVRGGRNITSQEFIDEFGFRGVEFGNWAASDERQKAINLAYEGLHDLASVLNIPPKAISLNGSLGLAFGARGGGRFAAHYEPGKLAINLTKLRGGGSLAHEWGHAVDHYLGELDRPDAYKASARGVSGWYGAPKKATNLRPELAAAFDELMQAIFKRNKGKAERVREAELGIEKTLGQITRQEERVAASKAALAKEPDRDKNTREKFIRDSEAWIAQNRRVLEIQRKNLAELTATPDADLPKSTTNSSFLSNAIKLSGKQGSDGYWARPTEMLARAFEAFVFDKIGEAGNVSQYLVQGVEPDRYAGPKYRGNPYPTDEERAAINAAWEKVVSELKTRDGVRGPGTALYQMPRVEKIAVAKDSLSDEQMVIPGAERVAAEGRKAAKAPQRSVAETPLFGGAQDTTRDVKRADADREAKKQGRLFQAGDRARLRVAGEIDATVNLTPKDAARRDAVANALKLTLRRMVGKAAPDTAVFDSMMVGEQEITGAYSPLNNLLAVSLRSPDPIGTVRHETIHVLRQLGLIDDAAWSALTQAAETGGWLDKHAIDERWGDGLTRDQALEEAIAEEFGVGLREGVWKTGNARVDAIFQRIAEFFRRVRAEAKRALAGTGLRDITDADVAELVFSLIERGAFREGRGATAGQRALMAQASPEDRIAFQIPENGARAAASRPIAQRMRDLRSAIAALRGGAQDPLAKVRVPNDIGWARKTMVTPRTIAAYFPHFADVFFAGTRQFRARDMSISELTEIARPYLDLDQAGKDKVGKVIEHGRMAGKVYSPRESDGKIVVENKVGQQVRGKIGGVTLMADGETVTLDAKEVEAYRAYRKVMDVALDKFRDQIVREWGFDPTAADAPKTASAVEALIEAEENAGERARLKTLAQVLSSIVQAKKHGYVPFTRYGSHYVTVTTLQDGKRAVVHREHIEPGLTTSPRTKLTRARLEQEAARLRARLAEIYPPDRGFEISELREVTPDSLGDIPNFSDLDAIIQAANLPPEQAAAVQKAIGEVIQKRGFRAHFIQSRNIPGYCIAPDTKILTDAMEWVEAGSIKVGDKLVGFEEWAQTPKRRRRMDVATVERAERLTKPCYRLTMRSGRTIVASDNHLFLNMRGGVLGHTRWKSVEDIVIGDRLKTFPQENPKSDFESGWFSGILDGEGWMCRHNGKRNGGLRMGWAQNPGAVLDRSIDVARRAGFTVYRGAPTKSCKAINVSFCPWDAVAALQAYRPSRLISERKWVGAPLPTAKEADTVISKEYVGEVEVVGIKTTSHTFIANGFASHNSSDFERSLADYIVGISSYLARREHLPEIEDAIASIPATQPELRRYAKDWNDYIQNPSEEFQGPRQAGFLWYLSGRFSSAVVNLSQIPMVTQPYLSMFAGHTAAAAEIARAYKDAALAIRPKTKAAGGAGLDVFSPDALPEDVRDVVKTALADGTLMPIETFQEMARAKGRTPQSRSLAAKAQAAQDAAAFMFQAAERTNRLVSFIAAYRLAQRPEVMGRIRADLRDNPLWTRRRKDRRLGATEFASFVVEETQFLLGKLNRTRMMRGPGAVIFQFKAFAANYIELMARMGAFGSGVHRGGHRYAALASMMFAMFLVGGLMGLPGAEDGLEMIEGLIKSATGVDPQIERGLRESAGSMAAWAMRQLGASEETQAGASAFAGRAAARGVARETGVDVSQRIGMGRVTPRPAGTEQDDFMYRAIGLAGIPGSWVLRGIDIGSAISRGDWLQAGIRAAPEAIADPMRAYQLGTEGVKTIAKGRQVINPDDVLPDGSVAGGAANVAKRVFGFQPTGISRAREQMNAVRRAGEAPRDLFADFNLRRANIQAAINRASDTLDRATTAEQKTIAEAAVKRESKRLERVMDEIETYNNSAPDERRYKLANPGYAQQLKVANQGQMATQIKKVPMRVRGSVEDIRSRY